jgi:hypothetical protein
MPTSRARLAPLLSVTLAFGCASAFAACGGSGGDETSDTPSSTLGVGGGGGAAGGGTSTGGKAGSGGTAGGAAGKGGSAGATAGAAGAGGAGASGSAGTGGGAGTAGNGGTGTAGNGGGGTGGTGGAAGKGGAGAGGTGGGAGAGGSAMCTQPDVLITLDRTLTMHFTPDGTNPTDAPAYASSKWAQAITAIEKVSGTLDQTIRFGLELWPKDPGAGCLTLTERIETTKMATNPMCQEGEIVVPLGLGTGTAINAALDPLVTKICTSTPTGQALITAGTYLGANAVAGRPQYVALVTDGADWDQSCPTPNPLNEVQKLSTSGIKTFVVGFYAKSSAPGGVGIAFLNDMACAGQTATGFPGTCKMTANGWVAADPAAAPLFLTAQNSSELETVLASSLGAVGCKI